MNTFLHLCVGLLAALLSFAAPAQFTAQGSIVTDTISGMEWLNLDVTRGQSFNSVSTNMPAGFHAATYAEVGTLFSDAGFARNIPIGDLANPERLAAGASFAAAFNGVQLDNGVEWFIGYLGPGAGQLIYGTADVYTMWRAGVQYDPSSPLVATSSDDITGGNSFDTPPDTGTWVVMAVPEPSTFLMLFVGIGFVVMRRLKVVAGEEP